MRGDPDDSIETHGAKLIQNLDIRLSEIEKQGRLVELVRGSGDFAPLLTLEYNVVLESDAGVASDNVVIKVEESEEEIKTGPNLEIDTMMSKGYT